MIIFERKFQPSWLMSLIALSGIALFVSLGFWQLDRAAFKQVIVDNFEGRLNANYQALEQPDDWRNIEYKLVILQGQYDTGRTLMLDNQLDQGRAGYHVLTPFELTGGELVLVDRGWVSAGASRANLPKIGIPPVLNDIHGVVTFPSTDGFRMGEISLVEQWPQVIPFVDIDALQSGFDNRLLPIVIWLAPEQSGLYVRDWQPVWLLPEKSRAYAVQWFVFAVIAFILFFVLNLRKLDD
jgi:surfeit locus 1 family protein